MLLNHSFFGRTVRNHLRLFAATTLFIALSSTSVVAEDALGRRPAIFGLSPDNGHALVTQILNSAKQEVILNIYELENVDIINTIKNTIARNVTFRILLEGSPVGTTGVGTGPGSAVRTIIDAMKASKNPHHQFFIMMKTNPNVKRRYTYDHAKYMVIDGNDAFISSENFSDGGQPMPGKSGNRGWHMLIRDSRLVDAFTKLYLDDTDLKAGDIVDALKGLPSAFFSRQGPSTEETLSQFSATNPPRRPMPPLKTVARAVAVFTSPQSLGGLTNTIRSARNQLDVEFMSLPIEWYDREKKTYFPSPIVQEIAQAAKRGVRVRVLLNDQRAFGSKPGDRNMNLETVCAFNKLAQNEKAPIAGKIVDLKKAGLKIIHNKGMIVDRIRSLISSINGTANSVQANRETAVLVESPAAANYFVSALDVDWNASSFPTEAECKAATGVSKAPQFLNFHDVFAF